MSFSDYNPFQLPCSSTFDSMARMGVVCVADKSFAGTKVPKKQGKNKKSLKNLQISPEKCFPPRMHKG